VRGSFESQHSKDLKYPKRRLHGVCYSLVTGRQRSSKVAVALNFCVMIVVDVYIRGGAVFPDTSVRCLLCSSAFVRFRSIWNYLLDFIVRGLQPARIALFIFELHISTLIILLHHTTNTTRHEIFMSMANFSWQRNEGRDLDID
jgi:hypothetical protein